jgi:aspartate racemase
MSDLLPADPSTAPTMARIGLLGGMSWESSLLYYRLINEAARHRLGGLHSADCLLRSVDFAEVEQLQREGRWEQLGAMLAVEARGLRAAGAGLVVLCANTLHRVADAIAVDLGVPLLHIADVAADAVRAARLHTVGLLGTADTIEPGFYVDRLRDRHGLEVLTPGETDRRIVHDVIFTELCQGKLRDRSRRQYRRIMGELVERGAQAIILACTEIGLLVTADDASVPVFDTAALHAEAALTLAMQLAPTPDRWERDGYVISTDRSRLDRKAIWRFLRTAYWSPGIARATVERNIENSLAFGLYAPDGAQTGFLRLVTDTGGFAWLADVFVTPEHRKRGLGVWLVGTALGHPEVAHLRILLATRDAHGLYERYGFREVDPGRYMERPASVTPPGGPGTPSQTNTAAGGGPRLTA